MSPLRGEKPIFVPPNERNTGMLRCAQAYTGNDYEDGDDYVIARRTQYTD